MRKHNGLIAALLVLLLLAVSGCEARLGSRGDLKAQAKERRARSPRKSRRTEGIKFEEATEFARTIQSAINEGDAETVRSSIDWTAIFNAATEGCDATEQVRNDLARMAASYEKWGAKLVESVAAGGSYTFLRIHGDSDSTGVWFRFQPDTGGIVYHDYQLARGRDGKVRATDIYISAAGENLSQLMRPVLVSAVERESRGILARMVEPQDTYAKHLPQIRQMMALEESNPGASVAIYKELPAELRSIKLFLFIRLKCAAQLSPDEYLQAIADVERYYGKDGSMDAVLMDAYFAAENWPEVLKCLAQMDRRVGGDPFLCCLRARILLKMDRVTEAREEVNRATTSLPNMYEGYAADVGVALAERDFDRVAKVLTILQCDFNVTVSDLTQVPEYSEFVASPQYEAWLRQQQVAQQPEPEIDYSKWPRQL